MTNVLQTYCVVLYSSLQKVWLWIVLKTKLKAHWDEDHFYIRGQKVYGNDMTRALK